MCRRLYLQAHLDVRGAQTQRPYPAIPRNRYKPPRGRDRQTDANPRRLTPRRLAGNLLSLTREGTRLDRRWAGRAHGCRRRATDPGRSRVGALRRREPGRWQSQALGSSDVQSGAGRRGRLSSGGRTDMQEGRREGGGAPRCPHGTVSPASRLRRFVGTGTLPPEGACPRAAGNGRGPDQPALGRTEPWGRYEAGPLPVGVRRPEVRVR